ncbi:MAG: hypothetical protein K0S08_1526 [Gammaproteobacteria bacterium]|jgi:hypothetical protein|nr:hypothetical protein [Gammaproteobacteria bacterium]
MVYPIINNVKKSHQMFNEFIVAYGQHKSSCLCFFKAGDEKKWVALLKQEILRQQVEISLHQAMQQDLPPHRREELNQNLQDIADKNMSGKDHSTFTIHKFNSTLQDLQHTVDVINTLESTANEMRLK